MSAPLLGRSLCLGHGLRITAVASDTLQVSRELPIIISLVENLLGDDVGSIVSLNTVPALTLVDHGVELQVVVVLTNGPPLIIHSFAQNLAETFRSISPR